MTNVRIAALAYKRLNSFLDRACASRYSFEPRAKKCPGDSVMAGLKKLRLHNFSLLPVSELLFNSMFLYLVLLNSAFLNSTFLDSKSLNSMFQNCKFLV